MLSYHLLREIWWVLLGVLLIGFAVMDGFDLGIGMLLPWVAKTDDERRVVINTIGPVWEGNQIWFILGGGAIFAAWPMIYATSFSGLYYAMLLVLLALIIRPVGFKYRSKLPSQNWRNTWDGLLFLAGFLPSLLFGVAIGNVLQGVPFHFDTDLRSFYTGTLFDLLNPFGLLCGLTSVFMLLYHGCTFLLIKTDEPIESRTKPFAYLSGLLYLVLFIAGGYLIKYHVLGYQITSAILTDGPSNPLNKTVSTQMGFWFNNFIAYPWLSVVPLAAIGAMLLSLLLLRLRAYRSAWVLSSMMVAGTIGTVGVSMFPFLLPSSTHPDMSLLVFDASSSQLTLQIMLIATLIFMPIILLYTSWIYYVLRGKVRVKEIKLDKQAY